MSGGEKTYEMFWDCAYCGHKKLLGVTHRFCATCGAPQNPDKRYFPPDHEKVAVQDHQFVGADVHCPACREPQSAAVKHCTNCGSPMEGGAAAARQTDQVVGPGGQIQMPPPGGAPAKKKTSPVLIIVGLVVVLGIVGLVVAFMWKKEIGVTVDGHSWRRTIEIEKYGAVEEKGACSKMPKKAKLIKKSKAEPVCKTRKIDQGDGTFKEKKECSEPVEQCTYEVMKWSTARTLEEKGKGLDSTPKWPEVKLRKKGTCEGCEREGERQESYIVHFVDSKSKEDYTCSYDSPKKWESFGKGDSYKVKARMVGGLDCSSLQR